MAGYLIRLRLSFAGIGLYSPLGGNPSPHGDKRVVMAYTITFLDLKQDSKGVARQYRIMTYLGIRMHVEGKFKATLTPFYDKFNRPCIKIKPVRLIKAKPYCGNHPGECPIGGGKKPRATYLEWEDWVKFHALVNRVLNRFKVNADVWSTPMDIRGKMWIRRGKMPRVKWDWEETIDQYSRVIRIWNPGTEDQFQKEAA